MDEVNQQPGDYQKQAQHGQGGQSGGPSPHQGMGGQAYYCAPAPEVTGYAPMGSGQPPPGVYPGGPRVSGYAQGHAPGYAQPQYAPPPQAPYPHPGYIHPQTQAQYPGHGYYPPPQGYAPPPGPGPMPGHYPPQAQYQTESGLASFFDFRDERFIKGAITGAALTFVLTNESFQKNSLKSVLKFWHMLQGGMEEMKERIQDIDAEIKAESEEK